MDFSIDLFDKYLDRTQTRSIKWDPDYMIERFGTADLIPFNHAEMDFECPQPIIDSVQQRSNHGIYGYTLVKPDYYESIIHWYQTRHNIKYGREEILYSTGVRECIVAVFFKCFPKLFSKVRPFSKKFIIRQFRNPVNHK